MLKDGAAMKNSFSGWPPRKSARRTGQGQMFWAPDRRRSFVAAAPRFRVRVQYGLLDKPK